MPCGVFTAPGAEIVTTPRFREMNTPARSLP